jgi:hypothetical protein
MSVEKVVFTITITGSRTIPSTEIWHDWLAEDLELSFPAGPAACVFRQQSAVASAPPKKQRATYVVVSKDAFASPSDCKQQRKLVAYLQKIKK